MEGAAAGRLFNSEELYIQPISRCIAGWSEIWL